MDGGRELEKQGINIMLAMDDIKPVQQSFFVSNENGAPRFCITYCQLNALAIQDLYPTALGEGYIA